MPLSDPSWEVVRDVDSLHPNGDYGVLNLVGPLMAIARDYKTRTRAKLSINDMSLPWAGVFDLSGDWNPSPGHFSHQQGHSVDFNHFDLNGNSPKVLLHTLATAAGMVEVGNKHPSIMRSTYRDKT